MSKKFLLVFSLVIFGIIIFTGCTSIVLPTEETNIVKNGDFSDHTLLPTVAPTDTTNFGKWFLFEASWWGESWNATITQNSEFSAEVLTHGAAPWDNNDYWWFLQLAQWLEGYEEGTTYVLTFDASVTSPNEIHVALWEEFNHTSQSDDGNVIFDKVVSIDSATTVELNIPAYTLTDPNNPVKLGFEFGLSATDSVIFIDNVKLIEQ
ncbi:MAG: hypothetical protein PWP54_1542 [Thermosipho sp. (in: thermotogales)]|nr:hypothetical protein [Thermosipho sp. (in: thermotogales)]MDN5324999.1 hypothetical protein [Thermosipho sp. (in: thermotogales)]